MNIKRYRDPAGLLSDRVTINVAGKIGKAEVEALKASVQAATPSARIERLRIHTELQAKADELAAELKDGDADLMILLKIKQAEQAAFYLAAAPQVISDRKTQKQRLKAGFSSGKERRAERGPVWNLWQAEADILHNKNPKLTKSEICRRVGAKFGVTRQAVGARVHFPLK